MFVGEYRYTIDAKGRLFIPAKLREELGEEFIISKGFDKCLSVYPLDEWKQFADKLSQLPMAQQRRAYRYFFSGAVECSTDAQGRVVIAPVHRQFAGLEKDVVIIGNNNRLEIWSDASWDAEQEFLDNEGITRELIDFGF